jgi:hypothetical protein
LDGHVHRPPAELQDALRPEGAVCALFKDSKTGADRA